MDTHRLVTIAVIVIVVSGVPVASATAGNDKRTNTNDDQVSSQSVQNDHGGQLVAHVAELVLSRSTFITANRDSTRSKTVLSQDDVIKNPPDNLTRIVEIIEWILREVLHNRATAIIVGLSEVTGELPLAQEQDTDFDSNESFTIKRLEAPNNVTVGETLTIQAVVNNPTDERRTQPVELRVFSNVTEVRHVTLAPGEQQRIRFEFNTSKISPQPYPYLFQVLTERSGGITYINVTSETQNATVAG